MKYELDFLRLAPRARDLERRLCIFFNDRSIKMRLSTVAFCAVALLSGADAFAPAMPAQSRAAALVPLAAEATMADSGVPAETAAPSDSVEDAEIPTVLPSDVGMDYVPLATMLATGQLAEADQVRWSFAF